MAWFASLALLGSLHVVAALAFPLLSHLAVCLRRPKDLRRRYGAWAVVTGPTSGMGQSTALELARRGMNLVLVGRNPAKLGEVSAAISKAAPAVQTKTVVFDVSLVSTAQRDEALRRLRRTVEELDVGVLVNNAGVLEPPAAFLHDAGVEAWVDMIRVNLLALTEVTAAVILWMVGRGRGAVVNFGSMSSEALPSLPLYTMYAATKRYGVPTERRDSEPWFGQTYAPCRWWSVWWRAPECLRERLGSGEIFVGLADTDAVAPEGAAGPSWRASGLPFLSPRRVPGETLGSSVVIVASLLGGVVGYRHFGVSELGG